MRLASACKEEQEHIEFSRRPIDSSNRLMFNQVLLAPWFFQFRLSHQNAFFFGSNFSNWYQPKC